MLKGHAARRASSRLAHGLAASARGVGDDWLAPILAPLLADPYGVVRYVAASSLRKLPGFADLPYDFMAPPDALAAAVAAATARGASATQPRPIHASREVLFKDDGQIDDDALQSLLRNRDNRPVAIKE